MYKKTDLVILILDLPNSLGYLVVLAIDVKVRAKYEQLDDREQPILAVLGLHPLHPPCDFVG